MAFTDYISYINAQQQAADNALAARKKQAVADLTAQKSGIGTQYNQIARGLYANYRAGQALSDLQSRGMSTGQADSFGLQKTLNYQNEYAGNEQKKQDALNTIGNKIADVGAQYSGLQARQDADFAQQRAQGQQNYDQQAQKQAQWLADYNLQIQQTTAKQSSDAKATAAKNAQSLASGAVSLVANGARSSSLQAAIDAYYGAGTYAAITNG